MTNNFFFVVIASYFAIYYRDNLLNLEILDDKTKEGKLREEINSSSKKENTYNQVNQELETIRKN